MAFTVRIELHHAHSQDYDRRHKQMEVRGASRMIQSDQGRWYRLPTGEYNYPATATVETVFAIALAAANAVGKSASILVSESEHRMFKLDVAV
jgi:hypothetical protein